LALIQRFQKKDLEARGKEIKAKKVACRLDQANPWGK